MLLAYKGPSMLDGQPIIVCLTGHATPSRNVKTGNMVQVWVLSEATKPTQALASGQDYSICGDCPLRNKTCYVAVQQAPTSIYKAYAKNPDHLIATDEQLAEALAYKKLRLTAYGDPSAIPADLLKKLKGLAKSHTGYTHQWAKPEYQHLKGIVQASVETLAQAKHAQALGYKTFRIVTSTGDKQENETVCPNLTHKVTCSECRLCDGNKANIVIPVHGLSHKIADFVRRNQPQLMSHVGH